MYIAVCCEQNLKNDILNLVTTYFNNKFHSFEFSYFKNSKTLLDEIEDGAYFDLIFMDIYLDNVLGIDVAKTLRNIGFDNEIAFLADNADFAVDGYEVGAIGYLLKPFDCSKFEGVLNRIVDRYDLSMYLIKRRKSTYRVPYDNITYVESNNSKCTLHTVNGEKYLIYKHLSEIEEELVDSRFLRCHRSYLVNMNYITAVDKQFVLKNGEVVLIRQKSLREIKEFYLDYLGGKKDKIRAIGER